MLKLYEEDTARIDGLAARLRKARKDKRATQPGLAESVGVSPSSIQNYERGISVPPADVVAKIALSLGVSADWILLGEIHRAGQRSSEADPDHQILHDVVMLISDMEEEEGLVLPPAARATTTTMMYRLAKISGVKSCMFDARKMTKLMGRPQRRGAPVQIAADNAGEYGEK